MIVELKTDIHPHHLQPRCRDCHLAGSEFLSEIRGRKDSNERPLIRKDRAPLLRFTAWLNQRRVGGIKPAPTSIDATSVVEAGFILAGKAILEQPLGVVCDVKI